MLEAVVVELCVEEALWGWWWGNQNQEEKSLKLAPGGRDNPAMVSEETPMLHIYIGNSEVSIYFSVETH